jgi:hypothetical protein
MSVEGRISVDVLFHDKDGTNAVNVVSLSKSDGYSSGKVAMFKGVATTANTRVETNTYRGADGNLLSMNASRIVFSATPSAVIDVEGAFGSDASLVCRSGSVVIADTGGSGFWVYTEEGTSSYTLIVYGES